MGFFLHHQGYYVAVLLGCELANGDKYNEKYELRE